MSRPSYQSELLRLGKEQRNTQRSEAGTVTQVLTTGHEPCIGKLPQGRTPPVPWLQAQPLPVPISSLPIDTKTHLSLPLTTLPPTAQSQS